MGYHAAVYIFRATVSGGPVWIVFHDDNGSGAWEAFTWRAQMAGPGEKIVALPFQGRPRGRILEGIVTDCRSIFARLLEILTQPEGLGWGGAWTRDEARAQEYAKAILPFHPEADCGILECEGFEEVRARYFRSAEWIWDLLVQDWRDGGRMCECPDRFGGYVKLKYDGYGRYKDNNGDLYVGEGRPIFPYCTAGWVIDFNLSMRCSKENLMRLQESEAVKDDTRYMEALVTLMEVTALPEELAWRVLRFLKITILFECTGLVARREEMLLWRWSSGALREGPEPYAEPKPKPPAKRQRTDGLLLEEDFIAEARIKNLLLQVTVPVSTKYGGMMSGQTMQIAVAITDRVSAIKAKIQAELGIPSNKQKLKVGNTTLDNANTLAFYNIGEGSAAVLSEKIRGGARR